MLYNKPLYRKLYTDMYIHIYITVSASTKYLFNFIRLLKEVLNYSPTPRLVERLGSSDQRSQCV